MGGTLQRERELRVRGKKVRTGKSWTETSVDSAGCYGGGTWKKFKDIGKSGRKDQKERKGKVTWIKRSSGSEGKKLWRGGTVSTSLGET